jgi:hypothetical protein
MVQSQEEADREGNCKQSVAPAERWQRIADRLDMMQMMSQMQAMHGMGTSGAGK